MRQPTSDFAQAAVAPSWLMWFSSGFGGGQGTGFGQGSGFGPGNPVNPYANQPGFGAPPPKKSNSWMWILGIVGVGGLLVCGCCGGGGYFLFSAATGVLAAELKKDVAGDPNVVDRLGEIENLSMDMIASAKEAEKRGAGKQVLVFNAKGSNGKKAVFIVEQSRQPEPGAMFDKIDLRLDTGEEFSIK